MPSPTTAASVKFGASVIADVASATVSLARNQIDVTAVGDTNRFTTQGFLTGTVALEVFYDSGSTNNAILAGIEAGTVVADVEVVWASGKSIKGDAFVVDAALSVAPNDIARLTATLQFSDDSITVVE